MRLCPLCKNDKVVDYCYKTYKTCVNCQHTYQPEPPPKKYQNPDEQFNGGENSVMGDYEKSVNDYLAKWLYSKIRPKKVLDIGCAYPYLAGCFTKMGVTAEAIDGVYKSQEYTPDDHTRNVILHKEDWEELNDNLWGDTDLITMVHVLEHFSDPVKCLIKAYEALNNNGALYVRSPNKDISGIERDHTEGHILIHPNIFGNQSIIYAAQKAGFYLHWVEHMHGYGQSSWVFRKRKPTISAVMIVKNEEEKLEKCISSVKDSVDEIIVLDTGSTDDTINIAKNNKAKVFISKQFDSSTNIKDFHFSRARNEALSYARCDWIIWIDADDQLVDQSLKIDPEFDAFNFRIKYGDSEYDQCRMFRNNWGVYFEGAIHEYPVVDSCRVGVMDGVYVIHATDYKPGRVERNLSILESEYKSNPTNKRTIFYLGNACREAGKHLDAIKYYNQYIELGSNFHDELIIAHYYRALSYRYLKQYDKAISCAHHAISIDDRWGELYFLIGECYYYKGDFERAISYLMIAYKMPFPKTQMFVEKNKYKEYPKLFISYCYEKLGDIYKARKWAKGNDKREKELSQRVYVIEVRRQGALGDVLCTTPVVKKLREKYPQSYIRYVTHETSIEVLKGNMFINEITNSPGQFADKIVNFSYPLNEGYPYTSMKKHLIKYFADCAGVELNDEELKPILNLLPQDTIKLEHEKPIITFAVKTGWSKYKEWPLDNWEKLVAMFPEYYFIQIGKSGEPQINGAQYLCGRLTLRESFSVMSKSILFVGLDSVFNHASKALGVPAVILFGSTSPIGSGYNANINLWKNLDCSPCYRENNNISAHPMPPCPFKHKCMIDISVDEVAEAIKKKLYCNLIV